MASDPVNLDIDDFKGRTRCFPGTEIPRIDLSLVLSCDPGIDISHFGVDSIRLDDWRLVGAPEGVDDGPFSPGYRVVGWSGFRRRAVPGGWCCEISLVPDDSRFEVRGRQEPEPEWSDEGPKPHE